MKVNRFKGKYGLLVTILLVGMVIFVAPVAAPPPTSTPPPTPGPFYVHLGNGNGCTFPGSCGDIEIEDGDCGDNPGGALYAWHFVLNKVDNTASVTTQLNYSSGQVAATPGDVNPNTRHFWVYKNLADTLWTANSWAYVTGDSERSNENFVLS